VHKARARPGFRQRCCGAVTALGVASTQVNHDALVEKTTGNGEPNALVSSRYQGNALLDHRCMLSGGTASGSDHAWSGIQGSLRRA
jgi:hypothetical protein